MRADYFALVLATLAVGATASAKQHATWKDFYNETQSALIPSDAQALIIDAQACQHFGGEDAYDAERARQITAASRKFRCKTLGTRQSRILKKYAANRLIKNRITRLWRENGLD